MPTGSGVLGRKSLPMDGGQRGKEQKTQKAVVWQRRLPDRVPITPLAEHFASDGP